MTSERKHLRSSVNFCSARTAAPIRYAGQLEDARELTQQLGSKKRRFQGPITGLEYRSVRSLDFDTVVPIKPLQKS